MKRVRKLMIACAALILAAGLASEASAGQASLTIPSSTLAAMGLGDVKAISDEVGTSVRGQGMDWGFAGHDAFKNLFNFSIHIAIKINININVGNSMSNHHHHY